MSGRKKIVAIIVGIVLFIGIAGGVIWRSGFWKQEQQIQPLTIAIVGPQRGVNKLSGDAMYKGIQLYVQTHNLDKILRGRPLEFIRFNDQNSTPQAVKIASDVASSEAVVVLGHYFSDSALASGEIYQKRGMAAITASGIADAITQKSEWYFRTIPSGNFQGKFLAVYAKYMLEQSATAIVFDTDSYGVSFKESYEAMARKVEMEIQGSLPFDREGNIAQQVKTIATTLQNIVKPGIILLALHESEAIQIIRALGGAYTIIGPDSFATSQFVTEIQQIPQEHSQPGSLSNGIYALTPFLPDLAAKQALGFLRAYRETYHEEPGWEAACYYDAMAMAMEAISRAELDGQDLATDRRKVRDALAEISRSERAVSGVTGDLYFDANRNITRPLSIGLYEQQRLSPAYVQYQRIPLKINDQSTSDPLKKIVNLEENLRIAPTYIVKTGLNINTINYLNLRSNHYMLDGYIRFRFQGDVPIKDLAFQNMSDQMSLGEPVFQELRKNVTVQLYHLKASFSPISLMQFFPFDRLLLPIQFRHRSLPATDIRFVPDRELLLRTTAATSSLIAPQTGWTLENVYQEATMMTEGNLQYSRFNALLQMRRINLAWPIKNLLPLGALLLLVYCGYYLPVAPLAPRLTLLACATIAALLYEFLLRWQLRPQGFMMIEYGIFGVYALIVLAFGVSLGAWVADTYTAKTWRRILVFAGRILHLLIMALAGVAIMVFVTRTLPRLIADILARLL